MSGSMPATLSVALEGEHRRIEAFLARSVADPARFDTASFEAARAELLRHIGVEEKVLIPALQASLGTAITSLTARLRVEHGAITSLMVPTPDAALVREVMKLLRAHNPLEEGEAGLYSLCDDLLASERETLIEKIAAVPAPPLAPHFDGHGTVRTARDALEAMESHRARRGSGGRLPAKHS